MIKQTIQEQMKDAMRARDSVGLETLRFILSQIRYAEINGKKELTDAEIIDLLQKEVKRRKEAIELFRSSERIELVNEEEAKLTYITTLLPKQLSTQEIEAIIDECIAQHQDKNFSSVMKDVMAKVRGVADGKLVSELVTKKLKA